jgi:alanine dehydrogenase, Archaeoglobus fulgidus type
MDTLILNQTEVLSLLKSQEVLDAVEGAFRAYGQKQVQMPPKSYLFYNRYNGDLRTMPAYIEPSDATGVKIVNVHPGNHDKGLPTVMAVVVLNDPQTGYPIAMMNGTYLTALRTGAAGAIASKYLSRKNASVVGFIGCGVQAQTQLEMHVLVRKISKIVIFDANKDIQNHFAGWASERFKLEVKPASSVEEACRCDILNTLTPVKNPIVRREFVHAGLHINAIGADAPGKEELDPTIVKIAKVVVDDWEQAHHSGEINVPYARGAFTKADLYAELGEIVAGSKLGRQNDEDITIFDSTGLGIQDIAVAHLVYSRAVNAGKGTRIDLFA